MIQSTLCLGSPSCFPIQCRLCFRSLWNTGSKRLQWLCRVTLRSFISLNTTPDYNYVVAVGGRGKEEKSWGERVENEEEEH